MVDVLQSSAVVPFPFLMVDSTDHITGKTGLSPTVTISKNAGAFASPSGAITEIGNGWYKLAANATDSNTLGILVLHATATGADPTDKELANIVAYNPQDVVRLGLTALPNAAAEAAGGLYTRGTGAGQINQPANGMIDINAVRLLGTAISTPATAGILDVNLKNIANAAVSTSTAQLGVNAVQAGGVAWASGAITSAVFAADAITDASVAADVTIASVTGAVGSVTGSVGSIAAAGISAASFAAGAIDAAAIAANAIGASELAADAVAEIADQVWDEILGGHLGVGSTGEALNNAGAGGVPPTAAAIADQVWDEAVADHKLHGTMGSEHR